MGTISKAFLDELRGRITLSSVIGQRVKLERAGREFKGCCPFHNEKTPSFYVNDEKEFYHCFGCGAHGDHIGFLMQNDNMPFMEVVETLAAQAGMSVPKPTPQEREKIDRQDLYLKIMDTAAQYYTTALFKPENRDILDYLRGRGLSDETIAAFRLGFSPDDGRDFMAVMGQKNYAAVDMRQLCLSRASKSGGSDYPFFRGRIMFPVMDRRGRVVAFGGRIVPDHVRAPAPSNSDFTPPKYMNSGETPLFHKGSLVYNVSNARYAAGQGTPIIVAEGYADVIALVQAGFTGAVAPLGTALTDAQVNLLWDMIRSGEVDELKEPILCFDGDNAGQRAAIRAMERILPMLKPGVSARFAFMPEGQDPDDLIRAKGREAMQAVLDQAIPLHEMIWRHLTQGKDFDRPETRAALLKAIEATTLHIPDRQIQQAYQSMLKEKYYATFRNNKSNRQTYGFKKKAANAQGALLVKPVRPTRRDDLAARLIIGVLLMSPTLFDRYEDRLIAFSCQNQGLDQLRQMIISILSDTHGTTREDLLIALETQGIKGDMIASLRNDIKLHASFALADDAGDLVYQGFEELLDRVAV